MTQLHGDWEDVLRRAGVERRRRWPVLLALVSLTVATALLATPAFGLREAMLDLIGREDVTFEEGAHAPEVVRKAFEDFALGAPPRLDPQAQPDRMRRIGTFRFGGKERVLYAGPSGRGGFCYSLDGHGYGCLRPRGDRGAPAVSLSFATTIHPGGAREVGPLSGWIFVPETAHVSVEFEDGGHEDVPFVYVSAPIDAGFFAYDTKGERRRAPHRPSAVVLRDRAGEVLAREPIAYPRRPPTSEPAPPQRLSARPPVAPAEPLRRGTARGVTVVAGANGAVLFDVSAGDAVVERMRGRPAAFVCFTLLEDRTQSLGRYGVFGESVGLRYFGLTTPFDGCEIHGSHGHRWPDRYGSHSPVEIAFTPAAERYYEDRAAARDLALFVRSGVVQRIRRLEPAELERRLRAEFGGAIDFLGTRNAHTGNGRVGVWIGEERTVFRERSSTGRVFEIEVEDGRIARENVEPLAKVF